MEAAPPVWEFDDNGTWRAYAPPAVQACEEAIAAGAKDADYSFGQWKYTVYFHDPEAITQMNMATGMLRPVRRTPPLAAAPPLVAEPEAAAAGGGVGAAGPPRELPAWLSAEDDATLSRLLLSPAAATEKPPSDADDAAEALPDEQLLELLRAHVPGVDEMMDRTGKTSVATYIIGTCSKGLPIYVST